MKARRARPKAAPRQARATAEPKLRVPRHPTERKPAGGAACAPPYQARYRSIDYDGRCPLPLRDRTSRSAPAWPRQEGTCKRPAACAGKWLLASCHAGCPTPGRRNADTSARRMRPGGRREERHLRIRKLSETAFWRSGDDVQLRLLLRRRSGNSSGVSASTVFLMMSTNSAGSLSRAFWKSAARLVRASTMAGTRSTPPRVPR